jgi:hypothetical protein
MRNGGMVVLYKKEKNKRGRRGKGNEPIIFLSFILEVA